MRKWVANQVRESGYNIEFYEEYADAIEKVDIFWHSVCLSYFLYSFSILWIVIGAFLYDDLLILIPGFFFLFVSFALAYNNVSIIKKWILRKEMKQ